MKMEKKVRALSAGGSKNPRTEQEQQNLRDHSPDFFFAGVKGGRTLWSIEVGGSFLHALFIKGI
jgi:hypothetical protein